MSNPSVGEIQVEWASVAFKSIAFGATELSDAFTISPVAKAVTIQIKADNDGTPASGDTATFTLNLTLGDPDGAGANEFPGTTEGIALGSLDTNAFDPAMDVIAISVFPATGGKLSVANNSAGRAITVSAILLEQRD